jgi:AcrR family transcriptional regulator
LSGAQPKRADARENRERLITAARELFAGGEPATLEAIAKSAGVGIGTLYRHFPRREALVEAVYREQIEDLRAGADALLATHAPADALRAWMDLFAEWAAAKRGMVQTLAAMRASGTLDFGASRRDIETIIATLLSAGAAAGELRADLDSADLRTLLAGILAATADPEQTRRLFDLTLDAIKADSDTAPQARSTRRGERPRASSTRPATTRATAARRPRAAPG